MNHPKDRKSVSQQNWEEVLKLLKSEMYEDIHKWYSSKNRWCYLTDKFGQRHEVPFGSTVEQFKKTCKDVRNINGYIPHRQRKLYRYQSAPPRGLY